MEKAYRLRTNISKDKILNVNLKQDYDTLEILSLNLNTENFYKLHTSNYGVIIGRVLANDAFGIPNTKISVFIELSDEDAQDNNIVNYYPYTSVQSFDNEDRTYNLLPDESNDDCYRIVGTFPNKRLVLDNDTILEIYDKYWKYTTVTNNAGDYMIFGVPTGNQTIHVDLDLSDIGVLSQKPRDMFYKGYNLEQFDSPMQFKESTNLSNLTQIISQNQSVYVYPFWGDESEGEIGISRCDIQIAYKFEPTCVFMGSLVTDNESNYIGHYCTPSVESGRGKGLVTGEGTIEMIRKTVDNSVEDYQIKGNRLIDSDGVWCYQIPMNLDYVQTDEYGNIVPTDNPNKGIPTRTRVRFRISYGEESINGKSKHRAKMLIPNNPILEKNDNYNPIIKDAWKRQITYYEFGTNTPDECYRDLFWNKVYSVKAFIPRFQVSNRVSTQNYSALKTVNDNNNLNPIPFNKIRFRMSFAYVLLCLIFTIICYFLWFINATILSVLCTLRQIEIAFPKINLGLITIPKIVLFSFSWFIPRIPCIGINGKNLVDNGVETVYVPGCFCLADTYCSDFDDTSDTCTLDSNVADLEDKVQETLSQEYDMIHLDFYNDWINGVLYFPLWYWKKQKKQKFFFGLFSKKAIDAFCECTYTRDYENRTRLKSSFLCAIKRNKETGKNLDNNDMNDDRWMTRYAESEYWPRMFTGVIRNVENDDGLNLYYYSYGNVRSLDYKNKGTLPFIRLYSTDLILLGSFNDCDLDGIPKLFRNLPSTTANVPFLITVKNDDGTPEVTGMDWEHNGDDTVPKFKNGLFLNMGCFTADTSSKTCINAERMCELGVTLDMSFKANQPYAYTDNNGTVLDSKTIIADGMITRYEIFDNETRYMFATLNHLGLQSETINPDTTYPVYRFGTVYPMDFDGAITAAPIFSNLTVLDNTDEDYITYRLGDINTGRFAYTLNVADGFTYYPLYNNSFYIYFGLNEGSTAIDKFLSQYDGQCFNNTKYPFSFTATEVKNGKFYQRTSGITDNKCVDYGEIEIECSNISVPYTINLYNTEKQLVYSAITQSGSTLITNFNNGNEKDKCLSNGVYTVEIIDSKGNSQTKKVRIDYLDFKVDVGVTGLGKKYYISSDKAKGDTQETKICVNDEGDYINGTIFISGGSLSVDGEQYSITDYIASAYTKNKVSASELSELDFHENYNVDFDDLFDKWKNNEEFIYSASTPSEENRVTYDVVENYLKSIKGDYVSLLLTFLKRVDQENGQLKYGFEQYEWNTFVSAYTKEDIKIYSGSTYMGNGGLEQPEFKEKLSSESEDDDICESLDLKNIDDEIIKKFFIYGLLARNENAIKNTNDSTYKKASLCSGCTMYISLDDEDIYELYNKYKSEALILYCIPKPQEPYVYEKVSKDKYSELEDFQEAVNDGELYTEDNTKITFFLKIKQDSDSKEYEDFVMKLTVSFDEIVGDYTKQYEECDCDVNNVKPWTLVDKVFTLNLWKPTNYTLLFEIIPNEVDDEKEYTYYNTYQTQVEITNFTSINGYINGMPVVFMLDKFYNTSLTNENVKNLSWYDSLEKFSLAEKKDETPYSIPSYDAYGNKAIYEDLSGLTVGYNISAMTLNSTENISKYLLTSLFKLLHTVYNTEDGGDLIYSGSGGKTPLLVRAQYPSYDSTNHIALSNQYYYGSVSNSFEFTSDGITPNIIYKINKYGQSKFNGKIEFNKDADDSVENENVFKANYFGVLDRNAGFRTNSVDGWDEKLYKKVLSMPTEKITPISSITPSMEEIDEDANIFPLNSEIIGDKNYNAYFPVPLVDKRLQHRIIIYALNQDYIDYITSDEHDKTYLKKQVYYINLKGGILLAYDVNHSIMSKEYLQITSSMTENDFNSYKNGELIIYERNEDEHKYIKLGSDEYDNLNDLITDANKGLLYKKSLLNTEYFYDVYENKSAKDLEDNEDRYYVTYYYNTAPIRKFYSFKINDKEFSSSTDYQTTGYTSTNGLNEISNAKYETSEGINQIKFNFTTCSYDVIINPTSFEEIKESSACSLTYYDVLTKKGINYKYNLYASANGYKREANDGNTYTADSASVTVSCKANAIYTNISGKEFSKEVYIRDVMKPNGEMIKGDNLNFIVAGTRYYFNNNIYALCQNYLDGKDMTNIASTNVEKVDTIIKKMYNDQIVDRDSTILMNYNSDVNARLNNVMWGTKKTYKYELYTNSDRNWYNTEQFPSANDYYSVLSGNSNSDNLSFKYWIKANDDDDESSSENDFSNYSATTLDYWRSNTYRSNLSDKYLYYSGSAYKVDLTKYNNLAVFNLIKYYSNYTGVTYENSLEQTFYHNSLCYINYLPKVKMNLRTDTSLNKNAIRITINKNDMDEEIFKKIFTSITYMNVNCDIYPISAVTASKKTYAILGINPNYVTISEENEKASLVNKFILYGYMAKYKENDRINCMFNAHAMMLIDEVDVKDDTKMTVGVNKDGDIEILYYLKDDLFLNRYVGTLNVQEWTFAIVPEINIKFAYDESFVYCFRGTSYKITALSIDSDDKNEDEDEDSTNSENTEETEDENKDHGRA